MWRRLSAWWISSFGRLGRVSAPTLLGAYAKVDLFRYDYSDYAALDSRSGAVVEAGVEVEF